MTLGLKAKTLNHETAVFMSGICMILGSSSKICNHEIWQHKTSKIRSELTFPAHLPHAALATRTSRVG